VPIALQALKRRAYYKYRCSLFRVDDVLKGLGLYSGTINDNVHSGLSKGSIFVRYIDLRAFIGHAR